MIRRLGPADAAAWRVLRLAALAAAPQAFGADHDEEAARPEAWFADTLARHAVFAAAAPPGLLAMAGLAVEGGRRRAHIGTVWGVFVRPEARGRGLGRAVMAAVIAEGRARGLAQLQLGAGVANLPALALYESLGFRRFGTEPAALRVDGVDVDEHLLWLPLAPFSDRQP
ncbi:MAG: GNAT family N-acetyltransferase [Rubritepida sp.]|nr:GNAT family N-acetyltransferase [Rubritepida sp.]